MLNVRFSHVAYRVVEGGRQARPAHVQVPGVRAQEKLDRSVPIADVAREADRLRGRKSEFDRRVHRKRDV